MSDISVVMGTYNGARYIREQLESILGQTEPPLEIIISDDGSTDDTLEIVRSVAQGASIPFVIIENEQQLGFADNFLTASRHATGRYISFSDQDDRWMPEKLARSRAALILHDAVLTAHAVYLIDGDGVRTGIAEQGIRRTEVIEPFNADPWGNFYGFTMMFDRALLDVVESSRRGADTFSTTKPLSHDRWIFCLASSVGRVVTVATPLAEYRQHTANLYGGPPRRRSLAQRLAEKMEHGPDRLQQLVHVAAHRADEFEKSAERGLAPESSAVGWRRIHEFCQNRYDIYAGNSVRSRAHVFVRNVRSGAYRSFEKGGLSKERLAEDLVVGVIGRMVTRR